MKIKKSAKVFLYSFLSFLGIVFIVLFLIFKSSTFQTWLTHRITDTITKDSDVVLKIGSVDIGFFNRIILNNVYAEDTKGDTLFNIKKLSGSIADIDFNKNHIYINTLKLDRVFFQLKKDSLDMNISAFVNLFNTKKDTLSSKPWLLTAQNLIIKNTCFKYKEYNSKKQDFGMNYWDLEFYNTNLEITNISLKPDSITFRINKLVTKEKCGLYLHDFKGDCYLSNTLIKIKNINLKTENSIADVEYYSMKYKEFPSFLDYNHKVKMETFINTAHVSFTDVSYFAPTLQNFDLITNISGYFKGKVDNFKGKDFKINFGNKSKIVTSFSVNGLPDYEQAFIFIRIDELITTKNDIEKIKLPPFNENKYISLPQQLSNFGDIKYKGSFTGLYNDFVAYGDFITDAGIISTDIMLKKQEHSEKTILKGELITNNLDLGTIFNNKSKAGKITVNSQINGYLKSDSVIANIDANIKQLNLLGYNYKNIEVVGEVENKMFNGLFNVKDTNLAMDFIGYINLNKQNAELDFTADVKKSNLYNLHLYEKDSLTTLSCKLVSKFVGSDIDKLNGKINLFDIKFSTSKKSIYIKDFRFSSRKNNEIMKADIVSDFMNMKIEGKYRLIQLHNTLRNIASNFIPAIAEYKELKDNFKDDFKFDIKLKNTKQVLSFFIDSSEICNGSTIKGTVNSNNNSIRILSRINYIKLDNSLITNLRSYILSKNDSLLISVKSDSVSIFNKIPINNISLNINTINNKSDVNITWKNNTQKKYMGDLATQINFKKENNKPILNYAFIPSYVIVNDTSWYINDFTGIIDSSFIKINHLLVNKNQQYLYANGSISNNPNDTLSVIFNDFSLNLLNSFINNKQLNFKGEMNGNIVLNDVYNKLIINSNFIVSKLLFNNNPMGDMHLTSKYLKNSKKIRIKAITGKKGLNNNIKLEGDYKIGSNKLDFNFKTSKLLTKIIQPFVKDYTSEMRGLLYSNIDISGTFSEPKFSGYVLPKRSSLKINYLNTSYSFSDTIHVKTNSIYFDNYVLYDADANKAYINGDITHKYFSDFKLNLNINTKNLLSINTTKKHNDLFYGTAYVTGLVKIQGTPDLLNFYVSVKTDKNTEIFIPLSNPEEIDDNNFINFISHTQEVKKKNTYKVNLKGINMFFDLELTSDAELQLIFDEKVGDIIKVRGNGKIDLDIDKNYKFTINGEYFISQGTYLFTLQNLINKKFDIKPDGYIKWTGELLNATTNIDAIYKLKASPYNLTLNPEDKQRVPVECALNLSNKLLTPEINFDLEIPNASDRITSIVNHLSGDELNQQILFLLITRSFYTNKELITGGETQSTSGNALGKTSSEMLSNQLSNWLSQISDDFDIGVKYRPGDEISNDELEVALSTQVLNDRVLINGNVGFGEYKTSNSTTNSVAGSVDVEVMVNKSGSLRLKAFNRINDNTYYKNSLYTQGVGAFYREDFNTYNGLKKKYMKSIKKLLKKSFEK